MKISITVDEARRIVLNHLSAVNIIPEYVNDEDVDFTSVNIVSYGETADHVEILNFTFNLDADYEP